MVMCSHAEDRACGYMHNDDNLGILPLFYIFTFPLRYVSRITISVLNVAQIGSSVGWKASVDQAGY
jgi:hypothetical protein